MAAYPCGKAVVALDDLGGVASDCFVGSQRICIWYWTVDALGSQLTGNWCGCAQFGNWFVEYGGHVVWMGEAFGSSPDGRHSVGENPSFRHD